MYRRACPREGARAPWLGALLGLAAVSAVVETGCASEALPSAEAPTVPALAPSRPASASPTDSTAEATTSDPTLVRTFGWVSIAIGAESAAVAAATSGLMLENQSTRNSSCNAEKVCSSIGLNANTQLSALAPWNAGAWVVAVAGLGTGTILILTHPLAKRTSVYASPTGVGLRGQF
jgi:hypothetical protein